MKPTRIQIPEELKAEVPHSTFGKILSATPVVMAVVATMLAGLSSSEMTRAQYERSLAAQEQSKAGDQWSFFQAKRLRGAFQSTTMDLLQGTTSISQFRAAALKETVGQIPENEPGTTRQEMAKLLDSPDVQNALLMLEKSELPPMPPAPRLQPEVQRALDALQNPRGEAEVMQLVPKIKEGDLDEAVMSAREHAQAFDDLTKPVSRAIEQVDTLLARLASLDASLKKDGSVYRDFTSARLKFASLRYEAEARLNQGIANLYEVQVRKSNLSAQRHHVRSQRFFFGMLAAQAGVIISTFAMAARKHNVLWSIAAAAGVIAVAFAVYVYLYV